MSWRRASTIRRDGDSTTNCDNAKREHSFFDTVVSAIRTRLLSKDYIVYGKSCCDLPCRELVPMTTDVLAADTGPHGGLLCMTVDKAEQFNNFHGSRPVTTEPIAGVHDWNKHHHKAYGLSQSLYELDPDTKRYCGEPNADAFAIIARENNAIIIVADGVNWGEKAFMAARSAVRGCASYLTAHLHDANDTQDVFRSMLRSFQHAHECILQREATLTTLCCAVVCKLRGINCYALCVVNVGDSLCYIHRKGKHVQEVTIGSHTDESDRDMRNCGGCLGPCDGSNPDLTNLTCSFAFVEQGDIVFLTSDGISDNFDPVIQKKSMTDVLAVINNQRSRTVPANSELTDNSAQCPDKDMMDDLPKRKRSASAPVQTNEVFVHNMETRRAYACEQMKQVIETSETPSDVERSAKELCANLIMFVVKETSEKRKMLEDGTIEVSHRYKASKELPGKLDHSTVAAFEVGHFHPAPLTLTSCGKYSALSSCSISCNDGEALPMTGINGEVERLLGYLV